MAHGIVSSPPSDTIRTRLLETNLLVADVEPGRSGHRNLKMVWENGDILDELLDENPSLGLGGHGPGPVDIEVLEDPGHLLKAPADIVGLYDLQTSCLRFSVRRRYRQGQASLLLGEQVGSDPIVVVQAQQLPPLPLQLVHCVQ
jgi:hypothetical protein